MMALEGIVNRVLVKSASAEAKVLCDDSQERRWCKASTLRAALTLVVGYFRPRFSFSTRRLCYSIKHREHMRGFANDQQTHIATAGSVAKLRCPWQHLRIGCSGQRLLPVWVACIGGLHARHTIHTQASEL